ncbi:hypothetical protein [Chitinophaga sp.]
MLSAVFAALTAIFAKKELMKTAIGALCIIADTLIIILQHMLP